MCFLLEPITNLSRFKHALESIKHLETERGMIDLAAMTNILNVRALCPVIHDAT